AVFGELGKSCFEAVEILHRSTRSLGIVAKLDEPGLEVRSVFPNFWRRRRLAASLGIGGKQIGHLCRRVFKSRERLRYRVRIERLFALDHFRETAGGLPIGLH